MPDEPKPSSSAEELRSLRALWLQIRKEEGAKTLHQTERWLLFLHGMEHLITSPDHPSLREVVDHREELCGALARRFAGHGHKILEAANADVVASTASDPLMNLLLSSILAILSRRNLPKSEVILLSRSYEVCGQHNLVHLAISLHGQLMEALGDGVASDEQMDQVAEVDGKYLALAKSILSCPQRELVRRSLAEGTTLSALEKSVATFITAYTRPFKHCDRLAQASLELFHVLLLLAPRKEAVESVLVRLESVVDGTPAAGLAAERGQLSVASITCMMECIVTAKEFIGFRSPESLSTTSLASAILALEAWLDDQPALCDRLVACLHIMAVRPRTPYTTPTPSASTSQPTPESKPAGLLQLLQPSIFHAQKRLVGALLSAVGPSTGHTSTHAAPQQVYCPDVVDCISQVFVCSSRSQVTTAFGRELLQLLGAPGVSVEFRRSVLLACLESAGTMGDLHWHLLLDFLQEKCSGEEGTPIVAALLHCMTHSPQTFSSPFSAALVLNYLLQHMSKCELAGWMAEKGVLSAGVEMVRCAVTAPPASNDDSGYDEQVGVLAQKLSSLVSMSLSSTSEAPSSVMVTCTQSVLDIMLHARTNAHRFELTFRVLLQLYQRMARRCGCRALVQEIARVSDSHPWHPNTSFLLALLSSVLPPGGLEAIHNNAIELLLSMVPNLDDSHKAELDVFFISRALSLLLPPVRDSDIWTAVEASLRPEQQHVQVLVDLCSGALHSTTARRATDHYLHHHDDDSEVMAFRSNMTLCGGFSVPTVVFGELDRPLHILMQWATAAAESDPLGPSMAKLALAFIRQTRAVLPLSTLGPFCERWREGMSVLISSADSLHGLAPYLISPKEASAEVLRETQEVWLGLHDRPLLNAIHLGQSGGIAGRVDSRHLRWPLSEGFAIATWLRWSPLPRQQTFRLSVWQLRFRLPSLLTLEFMVDVEKRCCFYTHQHENQASQSVELPFIPPDVWVHVVINHHSPKLYQAKLEVLYDGVPRASADVMYPPIPNSGIAGASATTSVKSLHVCVGAADGSPNLGTHLSIASLELFRSSLRMSEVVGLYCWGTEPSSMDGHVLPLAEAPILGSRVLRWIELQPKLLSLGDLSAESPRLTPPIYQATLLRLRARSVAMTNTRIDYLNAKTWGLINVSSGNGGPPLPPCVLHGCYAPIHRRHITYSDGLLSLGALEEWRSWMLHIEGMDAHGDAAACAMAAQLARQLVQVVGRCLVNRSEAMEMRWEQFITALAEHVLSLPFLYLHRSEVLESLLEVAIRQVGVDGQPVVYCSTLLGHIFLNWGVMSHMPTELLRVVLRQLEMLVGDSNAYRIVNVRRLHHADFFNGYVCGLFRHVLPLSVLGPAMKVVFYSLLADGPRGQLAMQMLQLCALSIPQEGDRWSPGAPLGSPLFFVGIHYIALVRNLLLKTVGDVWDVWPASTRQTFAETMTEHLPDCWYRTMTSATSHPVSAVLSMRCFMMCFLYSPRFREAHTMERSLVLLDSIASHAQQPDLLRCIHGGLLGQVWSMQDGGLAPSAVVAPPPPAKLAEVQPLLLMCLHLIKIRSLLLLRTEVMVEAPVSTHTYFLDAEALALQSSSQSCPRLRRWAVAVRCCVRLRRCREVGAEDPSPLSPIVQHRVAVSTFSNTLMTSIVEILDWAALHYKCDGELRKAMFRTGYHTNLINLAAWPLLCAIKGGTAGYVDPSAIVMGPSVDLPTSSSSSDSGVEVGDSDELDVAAEAEASTTTVLPTHSKSYNMDNVIPVSGMERVFDACRTLFLTHAVERFATSELIFVRQGVRLTKFVASLHQNLSSEPAGVGNIAKDLRAAFLCTVWLKAAEQCLDGTDKATTHAHRNAVMMAKYVVDRLMSGEAVPPRGVANYLIFLLCKFHDWGDTPRIIHGYFFTWLLGILSNSFHARDAGRVQGSIRIAYTYMDTLFSSSLLTSSGSVGQLLRHLLETTEAFAGLPQSEGMDESGAELASLWLSLLTTSKNAVGPTSMRHLDSSPLLMAGLQLLLPPTPSKPSFVAWLRNNVDSIQAAHEHFRVFFFRDMRRGEGASHAHLLRHTTSSTERAYAAQYRRQWAAVQESEAAWMKTCLTSTAVDLATLRASPNFPSPCMADWIAEKRPTRWHLHDNGMAGRRERSAIYPDAAYTTPLSAHVRYPPPAMISFRQVGELSSLGLQANATALLCRLCHLSSPAQLLWVGNVYLVVGSDCYPCTTVVTEAAVVVVSCCEVTRDGGICIARARTHTATMKSSLRPSLMVETLRRLLPSASEAFMTSSKAAFRHSQYYRQLQMRTSADAATVVWRLPLGHLTTLHHRHFQHMPAGLELEMETGERFLLVALDEELSLSSPSRDKLQQALQRAAPHAACESLTTKRTRLEMHTRQWRRGQLTNADYLRSLNDAASRAVTDLGQYPIAPWVLTDYATSAVDLGQPAHFRDLTKPVGALDSGRAEKLQRRYAEWPAESEEPPFHHGTHYSSCAITLHYLLRLEPFTAASERFQGGHLDMPERLFHSVQEAWEGSSGPGTGDAKELIPEFFSLPHFLRNDNAASLGQRSDGTILGDVVLPPWSSSNAARFVLVHGLALESSCVSRTLHEWIDLIFGHKQQGAAAVRALNLFHHLSYREGIERAITAATSEEVRQSIVSSADQFGQTPPQLFTRPHPSQTSTPLPTLQKHFLSHLRDIQTVQERNVVVHGRPNASVDQLEWVDGAFHCGAGGRHALSSGKDTTYSYVTKVDAVGCFSGALLLYFCTPAIHQLGCGSFSCLNASAGVMYVGTDAGIVLVFVRGRHRCCFNLISVLHPPSAHRSAVLLLRSFSCGRLVATYERDALVMGWQTSLFAPMMAFTLTAVMGEDRSPVSAVVYDHQRNVFIGAKLEWIIIFASDGTMLSSFHMAQQMMSCVPEMPEASCLISTLALMSVSSFDEENMLVVGHQRGHLTFWVMKSATEISEGTPTAEILAVKRLLLPVLSFPHPVRSICPIPMRCSLGVGLANGEIHRIQFPLPETDSSDSD